MTPKQCRKQGFAGKTNGQLLDAAEAAGFHVVLTVDQGFEYERSVRERSIAIIIFRARTNRLKDLLPFVGDCLNLLKTIRPGQIVRIGN